jgi:hypothetical protein
MKVFIVLSAIVALVSAQFGGYGMGVQQQQQQQVIIL